MNKDLINTLYEEDQRFSESSDFLREDIINLSKRHIELIYPYIESWKSIPSDLDRNTLFKLFILIVHADWNVKLQKWFLKLLKKAMHNDMDMRSKYALLFDRIRLNTNRPQRFGTQIVVKDYKVDLYTMESMKNIDLLRKEYNLEPLQDYIDKFK